VPRVRYARPKRRKSFIRRLRALGFASYRDYLASPHWREVRLAYRRSSLPQECIGCRSPRYQLHHRSYARIGREKLTDFIPLCRDCHKRVHAFEKIHGTRIQQTHVILRRIFGWTKTQTIDRFAPFSKRGREKSFTWVRRSKAPKKKRDQRLIVEARKKGPRQQLKPNLTRSTKAKSERRKLNHPEDYVGLDALLEAESRAVIEPEIFPRSPLRTRVQDVVSGNRPIVRRKSSSRIGIHTSE
jgi:hypothetical protein